MVAIDTPRGTQLVVSRPVDTLEKILEVIHPRFHDLAVERIADIPFHAELSRGRVVTLAGTRLCQVHRAGYCVLLAGIDAGFAPEAFDIVGIDS